MNFDIIGIMQVILAVSAILIDVGFYVRDHKIQMKTAGVASAKVFKKHLIKAGVLVLAVALLIGGICIVACLDSNGALYGKGNVVVTVDGTAVEYKGAVVYNEYVRLDLPEKAGYEAKGVIDERSGKYLFDANGKSVSPVKNRDLSDYEGCRLQAVYEPVTYVMSVRSATGAVALSARYTVEDDPADILDEPQSLDGYVFGGWFTDSRLKKPFTGNFADYTDSDDPLVLYPCYELQRWTIDWNTDGGEFIYAPSQSYNILTDLALPDGKMVKRTGYELVGWAENGVLLDYFTPTVRRDVQLTAVWKPKEYTITVYPNNGQQPVRQKAEYEGYYSLSEPVYSGYTFTGYSFGGRDFDMFGIYSYACDIQVIAQYVPNEYAVSYIVDGQTFDVGKVVYGKVFALRDAPTKANYEFAGWYDRETGGNPVSGGVYEKDGNLTVYANWIKTATIELESNREYNIDSSVDKVYVIGNYNKTGNLVANVHINIRYRDNNLTLSLKNAGFKAENDTVAINCENSSYKLTVINEGKSHIEGGDGSKGADGSSSGMTESNCSGKKGGAGRHALNCGAVTFESADRNSSLTLKSGRSGDGGNGGVATKAGAHLWVNYTPNGGNSGDVLSALHCTSYSENGVKVSFELGELGNAGKKGSRKTWFTTEYGKNGSSGSVSNAVTYK